MPEIHFSDIDRETAKEMVQVGIIPSAQSEEEEPIGHIFDLGGQRCVVIGYATRTEFLEAVKAAGFWGRGWEEVPSKYYFQRISTD